MKKIKMLPILIIMMFVMQVLLPVISNAAEGTLNVELKREGNTVNITATDTQYNIEEVKYVHKLIDKSNISYFEENNSDVYTLDITPSSRVETSFEIDGYGDYTIYVRNSHGDRYLKMLTVHDPGEAPNLTLIQDEENTLLLTIQATSKNSIISTLKIAKKDDINQEINFDTEGTDLEFTKSNNVSLVYTATEDGLYAVYAKDENGASMTSQVYLSKEGTPISVEITDLGNRKINIKVADAICNITSIKVAKASEISGFDDFQTKGENIKFTEGKTVDVDYTLQEDGTYKFLIEDEAGFRIMASERIIASGKKPMAITITQDEEKPGNLTITGTDTVSNIVELKVAIGENITLDYLKNNGEELSITPGRTVTANYNVNENCLLNVYIEDEDGYGYMVKKTIITTSEPTENQPPQITLLQNQSNPRQIDVTVSDIDSNNIETIKWAKGSHDAEYFEDNGTRIGQGKAGQIVKTEFTIDSIGTYTVFAKDEEGASTVKEINILSIDKVEEPDTTAPIINGVTDKGIYKNSVTPNVTDENLSSVTLTKNGTVVNNYQNGSTISEEGSYVLTARDEAGNETKISFTIDLTAPEVEITQENTDNKNVVVTLNLTDNLSGVDILKIAEGEQNISYFENGGQQINIIKDGNSAIGVLNVTVNKTFTAYVKDVAGNEKVQTFEVTTIEDEEPTPEPTPDTTAPTINIEKEISQDKKSVNVTINVVDTESQIKLVKMASGERDIVYFENNGTELDMKKGDKTSTSLVNITKNGTYTVYAEDESGNKTIETVEVAEIEEQEPEPEPGDTTPPTITGVENGKTYKNYVIPTISDENLASVVLTRNGNIVEGYTNGDRISENGNYVLTAIDKTGNKTEVSFTIKIEEDKNETNDTNTSGNTNTGNTNTNTNTGNTNNNAGNNTNTSNNVGGNNTNTGIDSTNTNNNSNNNNNNQNGSNTPSGSIDNGNSNSGNRGTSGSMQNSQSSSTANNKLPYTGTRNVIIIAIIALIGIATYCYIKYRKLS